MKYENHCKCVEPNLVCEGVNEMDEPVKWDDTNCTRAEKAAKLLLQFVNNYSCDYTAFAKTIVKGHKTLQQSVMRLFITTIREMAKVTPDDRNARTVELAKEILKIADKYSLPLI